jgi:hypothetical protein
MKPIFGGVYNKRQYPSPNLDRYVTAYVKEVSFKKKPKDFVNAHARSAFDSGCTLFISGGGGYRHWRAPEEDTGRLRELPWKDVWQIDTNQPIGVLDVLKYTKFYYPESQDRFDEFSALALPLMEQFAGYVAMCEDGGVVIYFAKPPSRNDWKKIAPRAWTFNLKHYSCQQSKAYVFECWRNYGQVNFSFC